MIRAQWQPPTAPKDLTVCPCGAPLNGVHDDADHACMWHRSTLCEWCRAVARLEWIANNPGDPS